MELLAFIFEQSSYQMILLQPTLEGNRKMKLIPQCVSTVVLAVLVGYCYGNLQEVTVSQGSKYYKYRL